MGLFDEVKQNVTVWQAAEMYGVVRQINCCPKLQIKTDFLRAVLV